MTPGPYRVEFGPHFVHWAQFATLPEAVKFAWEMRLHGQVRILDGNRQEVTGWRDGT